MNQVKFYDTSSLLKIDEDELFSTPFVISSITLEELENIKNSPNHSTEIKIAARHLTKILLQRMEEFKVHIFKDNMLVPIKQNQLIINNDMKILASALDYKDQHEIIFITNDLNQMIIATLFFSKEALASVDENPQEEYKGYLDLTLTNQELEEFYSNPQKNIFNALINQYIIIRNENNEVIDRQVWTEDGHRPISFEVFDSRLFGRIKPIDIQQQFAADSFTHNKITMLRGPAGSGKSLLSLGYLFNRLEKGQIDKIIIFCNTIAAKNSAKLGLIIG